MKIYQELIVMVMTVLIVSLTCSAMVSAHRTKVILYPAPSGIQGATDIIITVEGSPVFVYDTAVNFGRIYARRPRLEKTPMAYFDFSGTVNVKIKAPGIDIDSVTIRPTSLGIVPAIKGDTIFFKLDKPAQLTIEINNDIHRAIHLFANPLEEDPPKLGDPGVHYFGPGVHMAGSIKIKSNETVYIAGGAVVYGWIHCSSLENVKIMGRGIIDGSIYDRWEDTVVPINLFYCKNMVVDGITILNPAAWTLNTYLCENVKINNVKIISARPNSDGITTQSCKDLTVTDCFVRSWDDSLVVKGYDGDVKGITFDNVIIWTDLAQSCEIGYETRAETIEDIYFRNITILHNFHKAVLSIHNSDNALVKNVHYDNIVVEDAQMGVKGDGANFLIDLLIGSSQWSQSSERGNIRDIFFNNVKVLSGRFFPVSRIKAFDENHTIENIHINNLEIFGELILSAEEGKFSIDEHNVKNVEFSNMPKAEIISVSAGNSQESYVSAEGIPQESSNGSGTVLEPTPIDGENLALHKSVSADANTQVYYARNSVDGNINTYWEGASNAYPNILTVDLREIVSIKTIRIKLNPNPIWGIRTQTFSIAGSSDDETYSTIVDSTEYTFDPATANTVTVDFNAVSVRHVKLEFTANSGAPGGQVAEFEVY